MLTCKKLVEQGSEYVDGDLSGWRRFKLRAHLFVCVSCKRYIAQLRQTIALIGRNGEKKPQPSQQLQDKLNSEYQKAMDDK